MFKCYYNSAHVNDPGFNASEKSTAMTLQKERREL